MVRCLTAIVGAVLLVATGYTAGAPGGPGKAAIAGAGNGTTVLAQAAPKGKPAVRTLKAAYLTSLSFSPLFLALEKGYLQAENINLDLQIVQSASDVIAFLGTGNIDVAFGNVGDTLFNALNRGVDVKIVAGMSYYPKDPSVMSPAPGFVRKALWDSGAVKSFADLKGRKVALVVRGGIVEYLLVPGLRRAGLSVADVEVVTLPFPDQIVALAKGAVDAAIMPEPISTAARERGVAVVLDRNPVPGALSTVLFFGKNLLTGPDKSVPEALLRALRRAANELLSPEAIMSAANIPIWAKHTKMPAETIRKTMPYVFARDLALDAGSLLDQQKYLLSIRRIPKEFPIEQLVDKRYVVLMR